MSIDFWFSIGSTYTYLAVQQLDGLKEKGVSFHWRPFNVRAIMIEMDNIPFARKPIKAAYMWRDIERRAKKFGFPLRMPVPYPLAELELANRVAIIAAAEGWCEIYASETYRRWFVEGEAAGSEPNLSASIAKAGGKTPSGSRRWQIPKRWLWNSRQRRKTPKSSAYSVLLRSSLLASFFGAMTVSKMFSTGMRRPKHELGTRMHTLHNEGARISISVNFGAIARFVIPDPFIVVIRRPAALSRWYFRYDAKQKRDRARYVGRRRNPHGD